MLLAVYGEWWLGTAYLVHLILMVRLGEAVSRLREEQQRNINDECEKRTENKDITNKGV